MQNFYVLTDTPPASLWAESESDAPLTSAWSLRHRALISAKFAKCHPHRPDPNLDDHDVPADDDGTNGSDNELSARWSIRR